MPLYKCQYTGKEFKSLDDCQVSEYEHGGQKKKFIEMVEYFIQEIEKRFYIQVNPDSVKMIDKLENYYGMRVIHYRSIEFTFTLNGREKKYYRTSDPVGDTRWEWQWNTLHDLIQDFEKEFILPLRKKFEGKLKRVTDSNGRGAWELGNRKVEDIIRALGHGKTIRIEVVDEPTTKKKEKS